MFIITDDGEYIYGIGTAEDAGDDNIIGSRIDLWFPTREECIQFGFRTCTIYFLGPVTYSNPIAKTSFCWYNTRRKTFSYIN